MVNLLGLRLIYGGGRNMLKLWLHHIGFDLWSMGQGSQYQTAHNLRCYLRSGVIKQGWLEKPLPMEGGF